VQLFGYMHHMYDASYTCEYTKFVKWVKNPTNIGDGGTFLDAHQCRPHYFSTRVVSCRFGCLSSSISGGALVRREKMSTLAGTHHFLCKSVARRARLSHQAVFNNAGGGGTEHR
jgi:hypothetical protein